MASGVLKHIFGYDGTNVNGEALVNGETVQDLSMNDDNLAIKQILQKLNNNNKFTDIPGNIT
jgi:hypothetical protein